MLTFSKHVLPKKWESPIIAWLSLLTLFIIVPIVTGNGELGKSTSPFSEQEWVLLLCDFQPPGADSINQSLSLNLQNRLISSLNREAEKYNLPDLRVKPCSEDQLKTYPTTISSHIEAEAVGRKSGADWVIWGKQTLESRDSLSIYPCITVIDTFMISAYGTVDQSSLMLSTGEFNKFSLPRFSSVELDWLVNFIMGYVLFKHSRYEEALNLWQEVQKWAESKGESSTALYFYLATAYLFQGKSIKTNVSEAKADWDKALAWYQKSLLATATPEFETNVVWIYNNMGIVHQLKGELHQAINFFQKSLEAKEKLGLDPEVVKIYFNLGNIYLFKGQWQKALETYQKSVQLLENLDASVSLATVYDNLGIIYQLMFQKDKALEYYQKSFELKHHLGDTAGMAHSLTLLGQVYEEKSELDKALDAFEKALVLGQQHGLEREMAQAYYSLGMVYQRKEEWEQALESFQKCAELRERLKDEPGMIQSFNVMAGLYQKKNELEKALALFKRSGEIAQKGKNEPALAQIYDHIGEIYNHQSDWDNALAYYGEAQKLMQKLEQTETLALVTYTMGLIYLKQERYSEGYELMKKAIELEEQAGYKNLEKERKFLKEVEDLIKDLGR